mmetsp:Transcript_47917/g.104623  ORF Transcript_47917/g.104623 Transcript_47917/m.104623 type:complete len:291 (-) Transcript_47917:48-920(-)
MSAEDHDEEKDEQEEEEDPKPTKANWLANLKATDSNIAKIVFTAYTMVYLLQASSKKAWRVARSNKQNIQGDLFLVKCYGFPPYQLLVMRGTELVGKDAVHPDFGGLVLQPPFVFYRIDKHTEPIRGLWFRDGKSATTLGFYLDHAIKKTRSLVINYRADVAPLNCKKMEEAKNKGEDEESQDHASKAFSVARDMEDIEKAKEQCVSGQVKVTKSALREMFCMLAEDEDFIDMLRAKLLESMPNSNDQGNGPPQANSVQDMTDAPSSELPCVAAEGVQSDRLFDEEVVGF